MILSKALRAIACLGLFSSSVVGEELATSSTLSASLHVDAKEIRGAAERVLQGAELWAQTSAQKNIGVRLLNAESEKRGNKLSITLNFSAEMLKYGFAADLEPIIKPILTEIGSLPGLSSTTNIPGSEYIEFRILIDGVPLSEYSRQYEQAEDSTTSAEQSLVSTPDLLVGKRIAISPGHGWYLDESVGWKLQRPYLFDIVEDFVNADLVIYLNGELGSAGADVRPTRNLDKNSGTGVSSRPRWQEAAKYHIQSLGAPSSVWSSGSNEYNKDIDSRPLFANWIGADVLVSVHNNAGSGGSSGTETWYDTSNNFPTQSRLLATAIHSAVVNAIRQEYNPNWVDRQVKGGNGTYGENRLASRPAALIEVAFMSTQSPDNDALKDDNFKRLVARAIRRGIESYFTGTIEIAATFNGVPWSGPVSYSVSGARSFIGAQPNIFSNYPTGGYSFRYLSGGPQGSNSNPTSIVPPSSQSLQPGGSIKWTVNFGNGGPPYCSPNAGSSGGSIPATTCNVLSVNLSGTGSGHVISSPAGIDCLEDCTESFAPGAQVLLSASPSPGSAFGGWSGDCTANGSVTMNGNRSCTATFTLTTAAYSLTVSTLGSGSVGSADGGISCGGFCSHAYVAGTAITLAAVAASGWSFSSWTGSCSGGPVIQFTMNGNRSCTANFVQTPGTSPETTTGSAGNVGANSAVLNATVNSHGLSTTTYFEYWPDGGVQLTSPALNIGSGTTFLPFSQTVSGLICGTTYRFRPVAVNAGGEYRSSNGAFTTSACSSSPCFVLTLVNSGEGAVPIASPTNSSGCPFGQYHAGEHFGLFASAGSGNIVAGWGGTDNDSSTATVNTATMPPFNWTVFANYKHICYHLTLGHTGSGNTPVVLNPVSYCPTDYFPWGYEVRVEATSATGWKIGSWSGTEYDTTTSGLNFIMMPIGDHTAIVQYVPLQFSVFISKDGDGSGTVVSDPPSINCGSACSGSFSYGTTVNLAAIPDTGSSFGGWYEPCASGVASFPGGICYPRFTRNPSAKFYTLPPCRIWDTRLTNNPINAFSGYAVPVAGVCGVPSGAKSVAMNVTTFAGTSQGFLSVYPGIGVPPASYSATVAPGKIRASSTVVSLNADGTASVYYQTSSLQSGLTHFVIDVSGYFQ